MRLEARRLRVRARRLESNQRRADRKLKECHLRRLPTSAINLELDTESLTWLQENERKWAQLHQKTSHKTHGVNAPTRNAFDTKKVRHVRIAVRHEKIRYMKPNTLRSGPVTVTYGDFSNRLHWRRFRPDEDVWYIHA